MRDKYHKTAWIVYEKLLKEAGKFLTSNWVTYEAITILKSNGSRKYTMNGNIAFWGDFKNIDIRMLILFDKLAI
jgi:hypothetical protein